MLSFFTKRKPLTAIINGRSVMVNPRETLLQAALRQEIDFPYSCRVGGCATCKCKLVEGKVRELTESSYTLSAQELDEGYILACQSVPLTDIRVKVDLAAQAQKRRVTGLSHEVAR